METDYRCPACNTASPASAWDATTLAVFGEPLTSITADAEAKKTASYICPSCTTESYGDAVIPV